MSAPSFRLNNSARAVWFLILAGYAHLWLGVVGSVHQAHLLSSNPSDLAAICTQFGLRHVQLPAQPGDDSGTTVMVGCPICTVASLPAAPTPPSQPPVFRQAILIHRVEINDPIPAYTAPPALRPPPRAPPLFS